MNFDKRVASVTIEILKGGKVVSFSQSMPPLTDREKALFDKLKANAERLQKELNVRQGDLIKDG